MHLLLGPRARQRIAATGRADVPLWVLFPLFFVAVWLSHITLLRLPYFWDEAGYYIPAAWDFWRTGTLIPVTTASNAHPPLPSLLLAAWWHLSGFVIIGTRTLCCIVAAAALLAVYRISRDLSTPVTGAVAALLTAVYPVWFAQSTLAHADLFAASFTLWGLALYLDATSGSAPTPAVTLNLTPNSSLQPKLGQTEKPAFPRTHLYAAFLFSLAALSKETAILTPLALAAYEAALYLRSRRTGISTHVGTGDPGRGNHLPSTAALFVPVLPLLAWYAFHFLKTGFVFGNPEYLRYNATANLSLPRFALSLYHRLLHLFAHMNMFVPVLCGLSAALMPPIPGRRQLPRPALIRIALVLTVNLLAFSLLGGALLTRYLLPLYPLVLVVCAGLWWGRMKLWFWMPAFSALALAAAITLNPPYAFAPEDNLTYRDFIVLHQQAVALIATRFPQATTLTAWPATEELRRPELGYTRRPLKATPVQNFSLPEIERAAQDPGSFDTALLFSTKWAPPGGELNLAQGHEAADARYFDFHRDLPPEEAAALLHGQVIWQSHRRGEWAAVLRFPRAVNASLRP